MTQEDLDELKLICECISNNEEYSDTRLNELLDIVEPAIKELSRLAVNIIDKRNNSCNQF